MGKIQENIPYLRVKDAHVGNATEERGDAYLVVDVDTGGRATDGVHARQMAGGEIQRVTDTGEVIGRVGLEVGIPLHFLGVDYLAVDESSALAIGAAEIEADAAAFQVAAEGQMGGGGVGKFGCAHLAE